MVVSGLDLDHDQLTAYYGAVVALVLRYRQRQASWLPPAGHAADVITAVPELDVDPIERVRIGDGGGDLNAALTFLETVLAADTVIPPGRRLGHVPSGGDDVSALGGLLAGALNPFTAVREEAPGLVAAVEDDTIRWLIELFGLPAGTAAGLLTSGASVGTLHAIIAARHTLPARLWGRAVVYVSDYTHHCVRKAARAAGIRHVHRLPTTGRLTLDTRAAARRIRWDQAHALLPLMLVATAGSTDTGMVDDIAAAAALAHDRRRRLWLHVDAALGGGYMLTDRGRALMAGIEQADSVVMDAHKAWSMPYGLSALLVREEAALLTAFGGLRGAYMRSGVAMAGGRPDIADLGLELTREARGLRLWLPLYVHHRDNLPAHLDERLDWAQYAYRDLADDPLLDTPWEPDLTVVAFRISGLDRAGHEAFLAALRERGVELSGTRIDGLPAVRMCLTSHRTHLSDVQAALAAIHHAAHQITNAPARAAAADVLIEARSPQATDPSPGDSPADQIREIA